MTLPKEYEWLSKELSPKILIEALKEYGTLESEGTANNPKIIAWAKEIGGNVAEIYKADSIAWCGLFMAVVAKRAGKELPKDPLWALNWGTYGTKVKDIPMLGDVLVFVRKGGGHVGIYIGEDDYCYFVLGGNQSDKVCITRIKKERLYTARRTTWSIAQPANVRKIILNYKGEISTNEI